MKACVLHAVGDLRYEDVPTPTPQPGEVLLRIRASSICGSDIARVFEKGTYHFPTIPGHEFAGEVVELGEGVDPALLGRRAAVFPLLPCRHCEFCEIGEYAQCRDYDYFGSRRDGGFAQYLAVPVWNLVMVPDGLSYEQAAMCEPASVALHALNQAGVNPGDTVAIWGAGPIGLMLAAWARLSGGRVILVDIDARRLEFARALGYDLLVNSREADAAVAIKDLTHGRGADVALEGTGVSAGFEGCLTAARAFGRVVLMGNPAGDMKLSQKGYWEILRKQLTLRGTWNSSYSAVHNDWQKALAAMADGRLNLKALITHRFDFSQCNKAFELLRNRQELAVKVMFVDEGPT